MPKVTAPIILDSTGQRIAAALEGMAGKAQNRVLSLDNTRLASGIIEVVGIPEYVEDVEPYSAYGLADTGWYVFARISAPDGVTVSALTAVTGAAGAIVTTGADHIDAAVRFEVAAASQVIAVIWDASHSDTFIFKASDLAVRNLDYRTTFYVYDISPYTTWHYKFTPDAAFVAGTRYFTKSGDVYTHAEVETVRYILTADETFQQGKTYYTLVEGAYTAATVTVGETVTPDTYYEQTTVPVPAYYVQTHPYALTTDTTFQDGVTYYTKGEDDTYTIAEVTAGEAVTANTYYVQTTAYEQAEGVFEAGVTYYTKSGTEYTEAVVTTGDPIPAYYVHEKVVFAGMIPNVTYKLAEKVDCPIEITLPEAADDGHGVWFEIQMNYSATWSCTLLPPTGVKIGTAQTQAQTAGINIIDLQYTDVDGVKMWTLLNTHSNIPA